MSDEEETVTIPKSRYEELIRRAAATTLHGGRVPAYVEVIPRENNVLDSFVHNTDGSVECLVSQTIAIGDTLRIQFNYSTTPKL